jgi:hypothetical protein
MGTVPIAYLETGPFPSKNNSKLKCFLRARAPVPLSPFRRAQIDAAQQRS